MAKITGVLQDIQSRPVSGGKTGYDIVVAGQKYGYGLFAPKVKINDYVEFELDDSRGYKNVARNSLKASAFKPSAEEVAVAEATAPKKSTTGASFDTRQDTISRQAAMNTAIQFMTLAASQDALGLPAASAKGKRLETLEGMLYKYSADFYEANTGVKFKSIAPSSNEEAAPTTEVVEDSSAATSPADSDWT